MIKRNWWTVARTIAVMNYGFGIYPSTYKREGRNLRVYYKLEFVKNIKGEKYLCIVPEVGYVLLDENLKEIEKTSPNGFEEATKELIRQNQYWALCETE